jgi:hypothetical protein
MMRNCCPTEPHVDFLLTLGYSSGDPESKKHETIHEHFNYYFRAHCLTTYLLRIPVKMDTFSD